MESTQRDTSLSEAEVVRSVLAFLEARGLSRSLDALERESGGLLAQGQLPPGAAALRHLVVGGRWAEASAALKNLLPNPNAALFHLMRQKYLELICVYEELGNDLCDDLGHAVALCFSELSACCPSPEEHDELRRLARLSRPSRDPCMRNWDPLSGRRRCFEALRPLLPPEESTAQPPVDPGRLTDLFAKGLLYEADHGRSPVEVHLEQLERRGATDEGWTEIILMQAEEDEWPGRERFWNRRIQDGLVDGAPEILRRAEEVIGRWEARYRPAVRGGGDGTTPMDESEVKLDLPEKVKKGERPCMEGEAIVKRELDGTAARVLKEKKLSTKEEENPTTKAEKKPSTKEEGKVKRELDGTTGRVLKEKKPSTKEEENPITKAEEKPSTKEEGKVKRELDGTAGRVLKEKKPSTKEEENPTTKTEKKPSTKEEGKVKRELDGTAGRVLKEKKPSTKEEENPTTKTEKKPSTKEEGKVKRELDGTAGRVLKEKKPSTKEEENPTTKAEKKPSTKEEGKVKREMPRTANRVLKEKKKPSSEEVCKVKPDFLGDTRRVLKEKEKPFTEGEVKWNLMKGSRDLLEEGEAEIPSLFRAYEAEDKQNVRNLLQAKDRVREKLLQVLNNDRTDNK